MSFRIAHIGPDGRRDAIAGRRAMLRNARRAAVFPFRRDDLFAADTRHNRPPPAWKGNLGMTVSNRVCSFGANC